MKMENIKLLIGFPLLMLMSMNSFADEQKQSDSELAAGTEFFFSNDSDGFQTRKLSAEFFPKYESGDNYLGVRTSAYQYRSSNWSRDGQKISFIGRNIDTATANGWYVDSGLFTESSHTVFTFDGSYRAALAKKTAIEVFANRDLVETPTSLNRGVNSTFVGAAMDQGINEHLTVVGLVGSQFFSDDNRRDHGRLKLIYQPSLDLGLTVQARYRTYHSTKDNVDGDYFNPRNYEESMLALGWRHRFAGWTSGFTAGIGQERINKASGQQTQLFELNLQSPVRGSHFFRMNAGYSNSASYNGPNYHYYYARGEWIMKF
ncbi:hypothetical protein [Acinetobacter brisouii]